MTSDQLKRLRMRLKMDQGELANELGVTVATVSRWENGHRAIPKMAEKLLERIADEREVTVPRP